MKAENEEIVSAKAFTENVASKDERLEFVCVTGLCNACVTAVSYTHLRAPRDS